MYEGGQKKFLFFKTGHGLIFAAPKTGMVR
jgi:hypothetical protein